jgi:hypothetical protein
MFSAAAIYDILNTMSTITEIESAIERLPAQQVEQLAAWLERHRAARAAPTQVDAWLAHARGAATSGVSTSQIMLLTRGEE